MYSVMMVGYVRVCVCYFDGVLVWKVIVLSCVGRGAAAEPVVVVVVVL